MKAKFTSIILSSVVLLMSTEGFLHDSLRVDAQTLRQFQAAFMTNCNPSHLGPPRTNKIYAVNLDGFGLRRLTNNMEGGSHEYYPRWSPDGLRVAFSSNLSQFYFPDGTPRPESNLEIGNDIFLVNVADGVPAQLTPDGADYYSADWSPDGRVAIDGIFIADPAETDSSLAYLTEGFAPFWSPDGQKIAFLRSADSGRDIFVINADGSAELNLTHHPSYVQNMDWSPDSNQLVFSTDRDNGFQIYRVNADGSDLTRLTDAEEGLFGPAWSPAGGYIAFSSQQAIHIITPEGFPRTRVEFPYSVSDPHWLPDGSGLVFYVDDHPLVEHCPDDAYNLSTIYYLGIDCLESPDGCDIQDAIRIPNTEATNFYLDVSPVSLPLDPAQQTL